MVIGMGDILSIGGKNYLMPVVLFVVVLYAVRGMFSLHGRRSQQRKEFLEMWSVTRAQDDLWLEISVRHLFGTLLPAPIIRLALEQPDRGQALLELSELWPFVQFIRESRTVTWQYKRHSTPRRRNLLRILTLTAYFGCALAAVFGANFAFKSGPSAFLSWLYGCGAAISALAAFICLSRDDSLRIAASSGDEWLSRINTSEATDF